MALVKTHIVLDQDKIDAAEARTKLLAEIRTRAGISGINEKRFARYGVLTCEMDDSLLDVVRRIPGVAGVEVDQERDLVGSGTKNKPKAGWKVHPLTVASLRAAFLNKTAIEEA